MDKIYGGRAGGQNLITIAWFNIVMFGFQKKLQIGFRAVKDLSQTRGINLRL